MSFANHNILDIALSIIPPTVVEIRKALGTNDNAYGQVTSSYSEWVSVYGIVEPGSEATEHVHGIDFAKKRVSIWLRGVDLTGNHIQEAPDQIRYVGRIYNVVSVDDWYSYDNYRKCDCVEALNLAPSQRGAKLIPQAAPLSNLRKSIAEKAKALAPKPQEKPIEDKPIAPTTPIPSTAVLPELPQIDPESQPPVTPPRKKKPRIRL